MTVKTALPTLAIVVATYACSSSAPATPSAPPAADAATSAEASTPDAGSVNPACEALRSQLASALEAERNAQRAKHAALGVYVAPCGTLAVASSASGESFTSTPATLFRIASISKTFLAATMIQLAQAKKIDLDAPIGTWLPDFPKADVITVKMLLNHTSGIPDYLSTQNYRDATKDRSRTPSVDERISWVKNIAFTNEPGAQWAYSNTNYLIAGRIIDKATGSGWASQLRTATFEKASLKHTFVFGEEPIQEAIAPGPDAHELEWIGADGAVVTTPADLVAWAKALYLDKTVLDPAGFSLMTTTVPMQKGAGYGLGFTRLDPSLTGGVGPMLGHNGAVLGYRAEAWAYPDKGWVVASFIAKEGSDAQKLTMAAESVLANFTP
ncbi:MAG: serine hydrolase domain-containing protein [Polyangiaceae bacterium]